MKRKDERTKKLTIKYLAWWSKWLGMNWYYGKLRFDEGWKYFNKKKDFNVGMRCHVDWRYMTYTIDVNLPVMRGMNKCEIERFVVHELMHVVLDELNADKDHEERVVTMLENGVLWVKNRIITEGKNGKNEH